MFADKQELIDAVVMEVMSVDVLVASLDALSEIADLEDRLSACAALVIAHMERMIPTVMKCGSPVDLDPKRHPAVKLQRVDRRPHEARRHQARAPTVTTGGGVLRIVCRVGATGHPR